jgi:hypothetical protein
MKHDDIYSLSCRYSPPKINLRDAQIKDYGNHKYSKRPIKHLKPKDVSREDFDYYGWCYSFMEFEDLLFYLHPIALEYEKDKTLDCIDSYMYSLDRSLPTKRGSLNQTDLNTIHEALKWIWEIGRDDYADWHQCPNLQSEIGLKL